MLKRRSPRQVAWAGQAGRAVSTMQSPSPASKSPGTRQHPRGSRGLKIQADRHGATPGPGLLFPALETTLAIHRLSSKVVGQVG